MSERARSPVDSEAVEERLPNAPSLVEAPPLRFLIFDTPVDELMPLYLREFERYGVTDVVCACELNYDTAPITAAGIAHHVLTFADGAAPPPAIVTAWLELVEQRFGAGPIDAAFLKAMPKPSAALPHTPPQPPAVVERRPTIGVHCAAGLGRAPVLVT